MAAMSRSRFAAALAASVAVAFAVWYVTWPRAASAGIAASRTAPFLPVPATPAVVSAPADATAPVVAASAASGPAVPGFPAPGLAARVDGWARSSDPRDALRAYEAVHGCLQARADDRTPAEELERDDATLHAVAGEELTRRILARRHHAGQWCGDLRSDQVESRHAWLARAAAASLQDATGYFIEEGPDGLGLLRDGPSARGPEAWYAQRDEYIARALQHCDRILPNILAATARAPEIPLLQALWFWEGKLQCQPATTPLPTVLDDPQAVAWLGHMGRGEPVPPFNGIEPDGH